jgi:peptide/nickel transport system substrate-binding protein
MLAPMFDYLVRTGASEKLGTGIAEKWEMAPNGLSWTFYIRKGVKFHNGDDLTGEDVKFSLERAAKEGYYAYVKDSQERVEVVDPYTVRVYTKGPQPFYWRFVNFYPGVQGMIMPKAYAEKNGIEYFTTHPVGTGPFKLARYAAGDMIEYEALDKHYRQVSAFRTLKLMQVPEETTRLAMLKTGGLDLIDMGVDSVPEVEAAGFRTCAVGGYQAAILFHGAYDPRGKGMPVADARVRKALSLAVDREEIGKLLFYGKLQAPMPPGMWPDQPGIDVAYWREQSKKYYYFDLQEAKGLLKDAGYPDGFSLRLLSYPVSGGSYLPKLAEVVQAYWERIGVKAQIIPTDEGNFKALRLSKALELVGNANLHSFAGYDYPERTMSSCFWSEGGYDLISAKIGQNQELNTLVDGSLKELDEAKRFEMTAKAIQLCMDTQVISTIGTVPTMVGLGPRVEIDLPLGCRAIGAYAEIATHGKI